MRTEPGHGLCVLFFVVEFQADEVSVRHGGAGPDQGFAVKTGFRQMKGNIQGGIDLSSMTGTSLLTQQHHSNNSRPPYNP